MTFALSLARAICVPIGLEVEPGWVIDGSTPDGNDFLSLELSVTQLSSEREGLSG